MSNFIRDVFKTQQPDGTFKWDMTAVWWELCCVILLVGNMFE